MSGPGESNKLVSLAGWLHRYGVDVALPDDGEDFVEKGPEFQEPPVFDLLLPFGVGAMAGDLVRRPGAG